MEGIVGLITIPKKQVSPPPAADELLSDFAEEIDRVGLLTEQAGPILKKIEELQVKLKPLAEARKALTDKIDALEIGDDEEVVEKGANYQVEIGKRGTSREIKDLVLAKKYLGTETFMKVATITLKNIDDYLTLPQKQEVLKTKRTAHGHKVVKRG
jgi:hypothetical protein